MSGHRRLKRQNPEREEDRDEWCTVTVGEREGVCVVVVTEYERVGDQRERVELCALTVRERECVCSSSN